MASEWELGMGMGVGMGFGYGVGPTANSPTYLYGLPSTDTLRIDDLLDLSNCHDKSAAAAAAAVSVEANLIPKQESSEFIGGGHFVGEYHSLSNGSSFADDIYVPSEEAAELEWLSKFMEDSFTDAPYPSNYSRSYTNTLPAAAANAQVDPTNPLPGRGGPRTKRSRAPAASSSTSSSSSSDFPTPAQISIPRRKSSSASAASAAGEADGGARRCTHCASEKTPQWRTGPMGPKTLCNACGVRYKSGRLVPEYRPAASPTFVLTQHSNSHRKVMELRRQKEQIHVLRRDQLIG